MSENPYNAALDRCEAATQALRDARVAARIMLDKAESEWDAAYANLARYELKPGIPKPEYRHA